MSDKKILPYTARAISNLDQKINTAKTLSERHIFFAQKAFTLARHSQIPNAREIIRELRRLNSNYQDPKLSAWIMFAEGVIEYSDSMNIAKSKDRILRAHLVSQVVNEPTLAGTSAAWLGQFIFLEEKVAEACGYLTKAFEWTTPDDNEARSRAGMVFGLAFYMCGDFERAKFWMQKARNHAVASGDIAMQNIILYNTAALLTSQLMLMDCASKVDPDDLRFAVMSAQSAGNLNAALGISNQPRMVPVQRAELFTIERRWAEAVALFDDNIDPTDTYGQAKWAANFYAQRAWCKANLGDFEGCRSDLNLAISDPNQSSDVDDMAILHFRVAGCARLMSDDALLEFHQAMAKKYLEKFQAHQTLIRELIAPLADSLAKK